MGLLGVAINGHTWQWQNNSGGSDELVKRRGSNEGMKGIHGMFENM